MGQRRAPAGSSWLPGSSPEGASAKERRGARGALLVTSALALSLLCNAGLLLALRSRSTAPAASTAAPGGGAGGGQPGNAGVGARGIPHQEWKDEELQRMLQRAEAVFQMHTKLKDELVGTKEEPTHPFSTEVVRAMYAAHNDWGLGDPLWLDVFSREFLSIPRYPCFEEIRVGTWGDGGKWLCLTSLHKPAQDLVIYSIGSRGDTSFEKAAHALLGTKPHCFDPFVPSSDAMNSLRYLHFHNYGLGARGQTTGTADGTVGQLKDLKSIMRELGHSFVDVLKVDCEGCETAFVNDLFESTARGQPLFGQLQLELHRLSNLTVSSRLLSQLAYRGYRMFHSEVNFFEPGNVFELAFIHESLVQPHSPGE